MFLLYLGSTLLDSSGRICCAVGEDETLAGAREAVPLQQRSSERISGLFELLKKSNQQLIGLLALGFVLRGWSGGAAAAAIAISWR